MVAELADLMAVSTAEKMAAELVGWMGDVTAAETVG